MARVGLSQVSDHKANGYLRSVARIAREIVTQSPRKDRLSGIRAFVALVASTLLLAAAPFTLSMVLNKTAETSINRWSLLLCVVAFLGLRTAGQALTDLRWVLVNPLLYRVVYRYCVTLCRLVVENGATSGARYNRIADVSEKVVVIQKAQNGLMTFAYHLFVVVIPTVIEASVVFCIAAWVLTWQAPIVMALGLVTFAVTIWVLRREEADSLQRGHDADNAVFRQMGQVVGYSRLITEFSCFDLFRKRIDDGILLSMREHFLHFRIKTVRSLWRTGSVSISYALVLSYVYIMVIHKHVTRPGDVFLIVAYLDRLLAPLSNVSAAITGIRNALVSIHDAYHVLSEKHESPGAGASRVAISADGIEISQKSGEDKALRCSVRFGERVQLRGLSGSGKTTLLHEIFDAARDGAAEQSVIYLGEQPLLVEGTVYENIALGDGTITKQQVETIYEGLAAMSSRPGRRSGAPLEQAADTLSAGERQVLAAIRAIVRVPEVLIIDEGFNALDSPMEHAVLTFLFRKLPTATIFFASHHEIPLMTPHWIVTLHHTEITAATVDSGDKSDRRVRPSGLVPHACSQAGGSVQPQGEEWS